MAKKPAKKPADKPVEPTEDKPQVAPAATVDETLVRKHMQFGFWALAVFSLLGLVLEGAHGLKAGWYLDLTSATRRLSLTLGHAHGTLLGLVNIAFAVALRHVQLPPTTLARTSFALRLVTVLMPLGFVLGGIDIYAGDPGIGIVLVPPSAVILVVALAIVARSFSAKR